MHRNVSNVWWLAAVLGVAVAGCGSDSTAPSGGRPAAGQIAFLSNRDGNYTVGNSGIYLMNADGTGVTRLSNITAGGPVWSPDGTTIAFEGLHGKQAVYQDIKILNADAAGFRYTQHTTDASVTR